MTRQMAELAREESKGGQFEEDTLEREEAKEEEYDYFLEHI